MKENYGNILPLSSAGSAQSRWTGPWVDHFQARGSFCTIQGLRVVLQTLPQCLGCALKVIVWLECELSAQSDVLITLYQVLLVHTVSPYFALVSPHPCPSSAERTRVLLRWLAVLWCVHASACEFRTKIGCGKSEWTFGINNCLMSIFFPEAILLWACGFTVGSWTQMLASSNNGFKAQAALRVVSLAH